MFIIIYYSIFVHTKNEKKMPKPKLPEFKKKKQLFAYASLTNQEIEQLGGELKIRDQMKEVIDKLFIKLRKK